MRVSLLAALWLVISSCTGGASGDASDLTMSARDLGDGLLDLKITNNSNVRYDSRFVTKDDPTGSKRTRTWKRSRLAPHSSLLKVGDDQALPLKAMRADVRIEGFRARVTIDLFYFNDRDRRLEGTLHVRLPDDASPRRLAFGSIAASVYSAAAAESWREPKEARVVPRKEAHRAYRSTVRQRVDPALMEWSGAGVFATRVFPLEPHRLHRITLSYDVNLLPVGEDLVYRLDLPEKTGYRKVDIAVDGKPHTSVENPEQESFVVRVPRPGALQMSGGGYFAAQFASPVPGEAVAGATSGIFLVDASLSSNPDKFSVWLKLLERILDENRAEMRRFAVGFFSIETHWWRGGMVENTAENVAALMEFAGKITLEGATDLAQALDAARAFEGDLFLLSDGHATWGDEVSAPHERLFAYATGMAGTDRRVLDRLARESGGAVFAVTGEAELGAAAVAHRKRPWRIRRIEVEGGSDLMLAGDSPALYAGQTVVLAGRGSPTGVVGIEFERGQKVRVEIARRVESDLAENVYGEIAVGRLEDAGSDAAEAFAMHFRVVGESCSLLLLDREADYERWNLARRDHSATIRDVLPSRAKRAPRSRIPDLDIPEPLRELVSKLPPDALRVEMPRLARHTFDTGLPRRDLAARKFTYASIQVEAALREKNVGAGDALRALSTLVEESPGDLVPLRDVAYRAMEWGLEPHAYHLLRRVAARRPDLPDTLRVIAACLDEAGEHDLALLYFEAAAAPSQPDWFEEIAAFDYVSFLKRARTSDALRPWVRMRLAELEGGLPDGADLVVTISWNTDRTDVDLHVVDPRRERCCYSHRRTGIGGTMSSDIQQGHGPEMFVLRRAVPGVYTIQAQYYAADFARVSGRTRVFATIYRDWGRPTERVLRKTVSLESSGRSLHDIARISRN